MTTNIKTVLFCVWVGFVTFVIIEAWPSHDSTDKPDGTRSGMSLYTDNATGCQYVGGIFSVTPRMDADGKQLCKGDK